MIQTYDDLIYALLNRKQHLIGWKNGVITAAPAYGSMWGFAGSTGISPTPTAGSGQTCDNTIGPLQYALAGGGRKMYLAKYGIHGASTSGSLQCEAILHDRLVATSGLSGTVLTVQNVNTVALPTRGGTGVGVECWIEWYTTTGATTRNLTVNYTNSDGVAQSQVVAVPVSMAAGKALLLPFLQGDKGVQSVQSVQWDASTGTAGNFGVTLAKRISSQVIPTGVLDYSLVDSMMAGLPAISDAACLNIYIMQTSSGVWDYGIVLAEG